MRHRIPRDIIREDGRPKPALDDARVAGGAGLMRWFHYQDPRLDDENINVGPGNYVAWRNDGKVCSLRMEGQLFGGVPTNLELRLSVEDNPDSAGVAIDMIHCAKLALDRGLGGPIHPAVPYFCDHPPVQTTDDAAHEVLEAFIAQA